MLNGPAGLPFHQACCAFSGVVSRLTYPSLGSNHPRGHLPRRRSSVSCRWHTSRRRRSGGSGGSEPGFTASPPATGWRPRRSSHTPAIVHSGSAGRGVPLIRGGWQRCHAAPAWSSSCGRRSWYSRTHPRTCAWTFDCRRLCNSHAGSWLRPRAEAMASGGKNCGYRDSRANYCSGRPDNGSTLGWPPALCG